MKEYKYVGPAAIRDRFVGHPPTGKPINEPLELLVWLRAAGESLAAGREVTVTFVVDTSGRLLIADRHSEHVACAGGLPVLAAGEIAFTVAGDVVGITRVSNQSTGYCPEPESWPAARAAIQRAGLGAPSGFDPACVFQMCVACGEKCIVKDDAFECLGCGAELPREYNCQPT